MLSSTARMSGWKPSSELFHSLRKQPHLPFVVLEVAPTHLINSFGHHSLHGPCLAWGCWAILSSRCLDLPLKAKAKTVSRLCLQLGAYHGPKALGDFGL